jgi:DNA-binding transcriptional LysR family regulator
MMNIRQMEVFWAIMRTGSVTGAAKLLGISQPAVSKLLKHTEDTIGMELFTRRSGKLYPSPEAIQLFDFADAIFDNVEKMRQATFDFRDSLSGRIQVASVPTLAETMLAAPVARFLRSRPRVSLSVKLLTTEQIVNRVALRQADLGLVYGPIDDTAINAVNLRPAKVTCFVNRRHRLSGNSTIRAADLKGERIISFHRYTPWGLTIWSALESGGCAVGTIIECNHAVAAIAMASAGSGVAIVAGSEGLDRIFPDVVVRPFLPEVVIQPQVIYRRTSPPTRLSAALLEEIRAYAGSPQETMPA